MRTRNNSRPPDKNYEEKNLFEEYLSQEETNRGVASGTYFKGILRVSSSNWRVSHVSCEGLKIDVHIGDEIFRNRALHEDLVAILLLPRSDWFRVFKRPLPISTSGADDGTDSPVQTDSTEDDCLIQKELWQVHESLLTGAISGKVNSTVINSINSEIEDYCKLHQVQPTGRVVHIMARQGKLSHNGSLIPGCNLHPNTPLPESVRSVIFKPFDARYPQMTINRSNLPTAYVRNPLGQMDQIYRADMTSLWPAKYRSPPGSNIRSVGMIGSIQDETDALLVRHEIFHQPHSSEMLLPLREMLFGLDATTNQNAGGLKGTDNDKVNWKIPDSELSKRRDLRSYRIFTIDPYNAKDLDDALHITPLEDGTFEIGVHIADVSYFLKEGTLLDLEARRRATSIYLVQKVIPMLPGILCEQLCSLNPDVDRLAYSCIFKMTADGNLVDEKPYFGRTVIRSCAKLDYGTAQRMIENLIPSSPSHGSNPDLFLDSLSEDVWEKRRQPKGHAAWQCSKDVCMMNSIAQKRRATRHRNGALVIKNIKMSFRLDEDGNPSEFQDYPIRESNNLVEEFMLMANFLVAQQLLTNNGAAALLRHHNPPDSDKLSYVKALAKTHNIELDTSNSKKMHESILSLTQEKNVALDGTLSQLLMETLNPAYYIVAGNYESFEWAHYALDIPYYTHFTSPIRRYADVLVHRLLDLGMRDSSAAQLESRNTARLKIYTDIANNCNVMKMKAKNASESSDELYFATYLRHNPMYVDATVVGIGPKTFQVSASSLGLKFKLFVDEMMDVSSDFDQQSQLLTLKKRQAAQGHQTENQRSGGKVMFTHPNILAFQEIELTITSPVVIYLTSKMTGHLTIRCSLVCSGSRASNGFPMADRTPAQVAVTATQSLASSFSDMSVTPAHASLSDSLSN